MFLDTSDLRTDEIFLQLHRTAPADPKKGWVDAYIFNICRTADQAIVGRCDLRIGHNQNLYYGGNIGYTVKEAHRGNHYAAKACLLLLMLAKKHGMEYLYITCNPDNHASKRTIEYAGGVLEAIVDLPPDNDMYKNGDRQKCVYRFDL